MAQAIFTGFENALVENGIPKIQVGVLYGGADVPGTYQKKGVLVDMSSVKQMTDIEPLIAAAIRAEAVNRGYTVPALSAFVPQWKAV